MINAPRSNVRTDRDRCRRDGWRQRDSDFRFSGCSVRSARRHPSVRGKRVVAGVGRGGVDVDWLAGFFCNQRNRAVAEFTIVVRCLVKRQGYCTYSTAVEGRSGLLDRVVERGRDTTPCNTVCGERRAQSSAMMRQVSRVSIVMRSGLRAGPSTCTKYLMYRVLMYRVPIRRTHVTPRSAFPHALSMECMSVRTVFQPVGVPVHYGRENGESSKRVRVCRGVNRRCVIVCRSVNPYRSGGPHCRLSSSSISTVRHQG